MSTHFLYKIPASVDHLNEYIGKTLLWLTVFMAVTVSCIVLLRATLNIGFISMQESVSYMHASLFMLCLAYTAKEDGHVRVDIFYRRFCTIQKAWVNAVGAVLFLLPFAVFMTFISLKSAIDSWSILESSANPGGIPGVFILKTIMPVTGLLLALQGFAELIRNLAALTFDQYSSTTP